MIPKLSREGIWESADSHLYAVAVFHQGRGVLSDKHFRGSGLRESGGYQRSVVLDEIIELFEAEKVAIGKGDVGIHHPYDQIGRFDCGDAAVDRGAEAHTSLFIGQGNVH